ncbi:MAG: aspartate kinase [Chloroflexi bacterium]|nr:MAG: aspartate kinase [Chloroflexota bacterium]
MTLVMKFGGTSVGNATAIRETAELIRQAKTEWHELVVVASAMGSRPEKVTDLLLRGAQTAVTGDDETYRQVAAQLRHIHQTAIHELLIDGVEKEEVLAENGRFLTRFESLCQAVHVLGELTPRALDAISGMGEQMSVRILAAYLRQQGVAAQAVDATQLIVTDANFQDAAPLMESTRERVQAQLRPLLDQNIIPIVTGFIGATAEGIPTTLGRGGSDYSAAILGYALPAREVWIWTDVDGVMTADPRLVPDARSIPMLSYREVSELAYYGARVLHPKTMRPCVAHGIPLRIKNTFNPEHPGTVIVETAVNGNGGVKAVTAITDVSLITIEGKGMIGVPGIAARAFGAVARTNVSVLLISQASSEQSICFVTPSHAADRVITSLSEEFAVELHRQDIDSIWAQQDVAIITAVGAGMRGTPGIAGRIFSALGTQQVNIIAIAQGSSECSISLVVDGKDTITAVRYIHQLIQT